MSWGATVASLTLTRPMNRSLSFAMRVMRPICPQNPSGIHQGTLGQHGAAHTDQWGERIIEPFQEIHRPGLSIGIALPGRRGGRR